MDPRDKREIVLEEKSIEVIGVRLALTKQRPQFSWTPSESSMCDDIERG